MCQIEHIVRFNCVYRFVFNQIFSHSTDIVKFNNNILFVTKKSNPALKLSTCKTNEL